MAELLTKRQAQVLSAIERFVWRHKLSPSQRDIGRALRIPDVRAVQKHLQALEAKGYLKLHAGRHCGIELLMGLKTPVVSSIAAGTPIEAEENVDEWMDLPPGICRRKPDAMARIRGDSMSGPPSNINDGDLVGIYSAQTADPGKVVVFAIRGEHTDKEELTVKEFRIDNGKFVLVPHNRDLQPMRYDPEDVRIVGIYSGFLVRKGRG